MAARSSEHLPARSLAAASKTAKEETPTVEIALLRFQRKSARAPARGVYAHRSRTCVLRETRRLRGGAVARTLGRVGRICRCSRSLPLLPHWPCRRPPRRRTPRFRPARHRLPSGWRPQRNRSTRPSPLGAPPKLRGRRASCACGRSTSSACISPSALRGQRSAKLSSTGFLESCTQTRATSSPRDGHSSV